MTYKATSYQHQKYQLNCITQIQDKIVSLRTPLRQHYERLMVV